MGIHTHLYQNPQGGSRLALPHWPFHTGHLVGKPSPIGQFRALDDHGAWLMPYSPQSALTPIPCLDLQAANPLVLCPGLAVFLG